MADVVNLNRFKKAKRKKERTEKARGNRVLHGLSKSQKAVARAEAKRAVVDINNMKLQNEASETK